ncbi:glycerate kinase [Alteribacillus sp. YIM 98480]|uniref:glycerate kinase n=1 Tax=Alteribacillus sp. YIM 98480 TaxID=2606599 RepID=UPI00131D395D|nr:glycerate kinase [Alteribacillus sp. YIM 98480]
MQIILAPDSFKGSLSSPDVGAAIKKGVEAAVPEASVKVMPLADGGEGTVDALVRGTNGSFFKTAVQGPLGERVEATWGILGDGKTAVIEMAEASGLPLVEKNRLNPLQASTYGTGQLIETALDHGCTKVILGIGGSATNDGGAGMASALGIQFLDKNGEELPAGGESLLYLDQIVTDNLDPRLQQTEIMVACDVTNPLCGPNGASEIYGPQKGAAPDMIKTLDKALLHYANMIKEQLSINIIDVPGSGAAGGLGGGLLAFLNGELRPGIDIVLEVIEIEKELQRADLVITGEGKTDKQTTFGKAPMGVGQRAQRTRIPVICISGSLAHGYEQLEKHGIQACFSILDEPKTLEEAMNETDRLIEETVRNVMNVYRL